MRKRLLVWILAATAIDYLLFSLCSAVGPSALALVCGVLLAPLLLALCGLALAALARACSTALPRRVGARALPRRRQQPEPLGEADPAASRSRSLAA